MSKVLDQLIREYILATNDLIKDFALSGGGYPQLVPFDLAGQQDLRATPAAPTDTLVAAGIAVVAQDTGRFLLIQRSIADPSDPCGGCWEFPGGRCEPGETAWSCAQREWQEELGLKLPPGVIAGQWDSSNGVYRGYVWLIDSEKQVVLHEGRDDIANPDDPDKDDIEAAAWWKPSDLFNLPSLRPELREQADWGLLRSFQANKHVFGELDQLARYLRHGKDVSKFRISWLPEGEFKQIEAQLSKEQERDELGRFGSGGGLPSVGGGHNAGDRVTVGGKPGRVTGISHEGVTVRFRDGTGGKFQPHEVAAAPARKMTPGEAVAAARARMIGKATVPARSQRRSQQRDQVLRGVMANTAAQLGTLARDAHSSHLSFVDNAARVLRDAYTRAYLLGRKHGVAVKQLDPDELSFDDLDPDVQQEIQGDVDKQHGFLQGLTQDLVAGLEGAALAARLDQYAGTTIGAYEQGYQDAAVDALTPTDGDPEAGGIMATWVVTAEDPCALCEEKNGQVWPYEEAPLPGDGDFGEICEGAMNCRCVLEYEWVPQDTGIANPLEDFEAA